ncbi:MAG: Phosphoribosylaminoimidazole-succinocarboxamide synthase [Wolbachia endosymbiont of Ctenocephalides orientis wCori]|nr:MAG: Phosphoribosylaminoimidazole-succinocarboxamide synthase [Wolbachia endosymbiont of Ctenocephalides orientis wCori]
MSSAGSFCKRFDIKEGESLISPIIEFFYKNDDLGDPIVNADHVLHFNSLSRQEMEKLSPQF